MLDKPIPDQALKTSEESSAGKRRIMASQAMRARLAAAGSAAWAWKYRVAALAGVVTFLWYFVVPAILGPLVSVETIVRADFVQSVVASGHVEAPFRVNVGSQITGVVAAVPVAEGQAVKAGDALIVLNDREARAAVVQAESAVAQAEARMRQLRELTLPSADEGLNQAKTTLTNAQKAFNRASKLAIDGYGTRVALDEATKALDIARAQVRNAELQVYTNRPGGSDYVMAETLLNQARAALTTAQSRLSYTTIVAPKDGVLISRNVESGNVVQPSSILMTLSPVGDTQLVVQIDEKNLGLIALAQKALVSADAFPKETFTAEVVYINPGVDLQRASVEVKLRVADPPAYLRQDMTVSVDISVAKRSGAVIAPVTSVHDLNGSAPWVMKIANGRATRQPIKIGLVSGGKAEILDGLASGDAVLPATSTIKSGAKVRQQPAPVRTP